MLYALYQNVIYEVAEVIRDNNGNTTHVRLETQSGPTVPIPVDQITFVPFPSLGSGGAGGGSGGSGGSGGTGGGSTSTVILSDTAPNNPTPGLVWRNTSNQTVNGIPAGNFAVWNGSGWVSVGAGQPSSSVISAATAPAGPSLGQVWLNTSGGTVSGVAPGNFAVWNGTAWVPIGTFQPSASTASAAATITLTGDATGTGTGTVPVTLANSGAVAGTYGSASQIPVLTVDGKGRVTSVSQVALPPAGGGGVSEIDVNGSGNLVGAVNLAGAGLALVGNTINLDAYATDAELTAAIAAHAAAGDPHAQYLLDTETFGSRYLAQNTAPTSPTTGDIWRNTNNATVNGIPAGNYAVWTGTAWRDAGSQYPFLVNSGNFPLSAFTPGANNTFLQTNGSGQVVWSSIATLQVPLTAQNPGFTARFNSPLAASGDGVVYHIILPNEVADPLTMHNSTTGVATIPPDLGGLWEININMTLNFAGGDHGFVAYSLNGVNNLVALSYGQVNLSGYAIATLSPGDQIRAHAAIAATGNTGQISNLSFSMYLKYKL